MVKHDRLVQHERVSGASTAGGALSPQINCARSRLFQLRAANHGTMRRSASSTSGVETAKLKRR